MREKAIHARERCVHEARQSEMASITSSQGYHPSRLPSEASSSFPSTPQHRSHAFLIPQRWSCCVAGCRQMPAPTSAIV